MARDHDKSIRAMRREALRCEKESRDDLPSQESAALLMTAAALSFSANYLSQIVGKEERAAKRAKRARG